jgi:branched-chain amino acid transport system ATP-binding protein
MSALLSVQGLGKRFGGLVAVKDISFDIGRGEILGILGPNGAGKTTLFNLLTGFMRPDTGRAWFAGCDLVGRRPEAIVNLGLARTFQLCRPLLGMSVRENVMIGCLAARVRRRENPFERADRILAQVGLEPLAASLVDVLPYGDLRRLEIARALATGPELLLLDEPFAGLGAREIGPLSALIRRLRAEQDLSILIIEHHLREFMQLVERVIAMDFGEVIAIGRPAEIVCNPRVIDAYIGQEDEPAREDADGVA